MRKVLAGVLHLIYINVSIFYHSAEFDFILNVNHVRLILSCVFADVSCTNKKINEALSSACICEVGGCQLTVTAAATAGSITLSQRVNASCCCE